MTKISFLELVQKKCEPCEGKGKPLAADQAKTYLAELADWSLAPDGKSIKAEYVMKNFVCSVGLINQIADVAEAESHHPDIHLTGYRKLGIELSTHAIGGLSENDFILAAKISQLPKDLKKG